MAARASASICGLTNTEAAKGASEYARCPSFPIDPFAAQLLRQTDLKTIVHVEILEDSRADLAAYATIPISFEVHEVLDVDALAGVRSLASPPVRPVAHPYLKDYDAGDNGPRSWARCFDLRQWTFLLANVGPRRVGGAAVLFPADGLEVPSDRAVLWDVRVIPDARGQGVGSALLQRAEEWAARRGARFLAAETQHINVPAYRFYVRSGFALAEVRRGAYAEHPDEVRLWLEKSLAPAV